jgi:hypothetical protein
VFCRCGEEIPDTARFCPSCGSALQSDVTGVRPSEEATRAGSAAASGGAHGRPKSSSGGWLTGSDFIDHGRFAPGALLDGRYRIVGLLGRGGMGEVYRADDLRLGQPVALKFLPEDLRHDTVRLAQFHNEVRTARQVSHPNVCRVYDITEAEGLLCLSMEYVDGEDLATSLRRVGRFAEDKASDIARQLCAGLAAAHQRGVVHRDLKPANVMLDRSGTVRVMDFGLAAIGQVEDVRAGTPAYMAPEQLLGREVTTRSDIFALGLVMYELFTGRRAFTAATVGELVSQHEARSTPPPSSLITALDPAIDRAILRCLDPDPERRPPSALAVAAALPGGNPLAAALAAGETPSPEMVAAAGEGTGLRLAIAWPLFLVVLAGIAASLVLALRASPLDRIRPRYPSVVLAEKARDALRQAGYAASERDDAYGFLWGEDLIAHISVSDAPSPAWTEVLVQRPSPLTFWYRRSREPLTALTFHTDLLIPGLVRPDDPPPVVSGMTRVELDHQGRLLYLEVMPAQRLEAPIAPAPVDWSPLFTLAGLDRSQLKETAPLWTWLATSDARAAWIGTWPESGRDLRVEAAALGGKPVAFMVTGPWHKPWRMAEDSSTSESAIAFVLVALAIGILGGSALLARRNLREGRGDRAGAARLAVGVWGILMALWICQVHVFPSLGLFVMFLLAVCTSVFYGVLVWTLYIAVEPFVRRHWPQVLLSWTNVLTGHIRDPIVGRDVLIGTALAVGWMMMFQGMALFTEETFARFPGKMELLDGLRPTIGSVLEQAPYAIRNVLLYFFLLFLLRVLLRREWAAALALAGGFALLNLPGDEPTNALLSFVYFGSGAIVVMRWGLLAYVVAVFASSLLLNAPVTLDMSAWYFGNATLLVAIVVALATWGFYTSVSGRVWKTDPLAP